MRRRLRGATRGRGRKWAWGHSLADVRQISECCSASVVQSCSLMTADCWPVLIIAGVRYALQYARKQEELRQQNPLKRADQDQGIRHPATDIINSLNPITWWVNYLSKDKQRRPAEKSMRKRLKKTRARAGELRRRPMVHPKGKVMDDEKIGSWFEIRIQQMLTGVWVVIWNVKMFVPSLSL